MSDEQKDILQMVSDGKISAEDGVKLLEALKVGEQKRRDIESPASRVRRQKKSMMTMMKNGNITDMGHMHDIGRMIKGIVRDSMSGITSGNDFSETEHNEENMEEDGILQDSLEIEKGSELVIRSSRKIRKGGNLVLTGVEGSACEIVGENRPEVHVYREDGTVLLKWESGDLVLNVPETVSMVNASIMGGDLVFGGIDAESSLKTKGGNIIVENASESFRARTMGGNLMISLGLNWHSDSTASTMGGNIDLHVPKNIAASITAKTMGGVIDVQEGLGVVEEAGHHGLSRVRIEMTEDEDAPTMRVKTMGGNICVFNADEEHTGESVSEKSEGKRTGKSSKRKKRDKDE